MSLAWSLAVYLTIAAVISILDWRKPHSESYDDRQHMKNGVAGGILWPAGLFVLAVAYGMQLFLSQAAVASVPVDVGEEDLKVRTTAAGK